MQQVKATMEFPTIRIQHGFSINQLAKEMGVAPSVVHHIEKQKNVRPATAKKAVEALGEPFAVLFTIIET